MLSIPFLYIPMVFFSETEKKQILKPLQRTPNSKYNLEKKKKTDRGLTLPILKHLRKLIWSTVWYWHKDKTHRPMAYHREPRNKPLHMWSNDLQQRCQEYTMGKKDILFNRWGWGNWISIGQRMKLEPYFTLHIKFNSKLMKDLNIKPENHQTTRKKHSGTASRHWIWQCLAPKAQATKTN